MANPGTGNAQGDQQQWTQAAGRSEQGRQPARQQGAQAAPPVLNVVNVIDPKEVMTQALSDNGGQNIIIDVMAKNRNKAKVALGI